MSFPTILGVALLLTRRYLLALPVATGIAALAIGIPTDVLPNPWFTRMTPVRTLDAVLWPLTSLTVGALAATFVLPSTRRRRPELGASAGGGLLSVFAVRRLATARGTSLLLAVAAVPRSRRVPRTSSARARKSRAHRSRTPRR